MAFSKRAVLLYAMLAWGVFCAPSQVYDFGSYYNYNGGPLAQIFPRAHPPDFDVGNVVAVIGGGAHSVALRSDGTASVWGDFRVAGTTDPPIADIIAVAAGFSHSVAIRQDGSIYVWGDNEFGQLDAPEGLTNVIGAAAGFTSSVALKADGKLVLWGQSSSPFGITSLSNVVSIGMGQSRWVAVKADGSVVWAGVTLPAGLTNIIQGAAGDGHLILLKGDGTVVGFGDDTFGQTTPPQGLSNVVAVAAGGTHSMALKRDGSVALWGSGTTFNLQSELGGEFGQLMIPDGVANISALSAGWAHSLLLSTETAPFMTDRPASRVVTAGSTTWLRSLASGLLPISYQWRFKGQDIQGATNNVLELIGITLEQAGDYTVVATNALGKATNEASVAVAPFFLSTAPFSQSAILGGAASFNVVVSGTGPFTYRWKFNGEEIEGANQSTLTLTNVQPAQVGAYSVTVSNAFGSMTLPEVTLSLSQVAAWGSNTYGQTNVPPGASNIWALAASASHALALKTDGTVIAWGNNSSGQTNVPIDLTNVVRISSGGGHSLALKDDGTVVGWGSPNATTGLSAFSNVVDIASGSAFSLMLHANGRVNIRGFAPSTNWVSASNIVAITASDRLAAGLKSDGTVVVWGTLLLDSGRITFPPTSPPPLTNIVAVAVGSNHLVALKANGTVETRGTDRNGQLSVPAGLSNVVAVAAGSAHSMALRRDGTVVAWGGSNSTGRPLPFVTASNTTVNFGQGIVPSFLPKVTQIAASGFNSYALLGEGPPRLVTPMVDRTVLAGSNAFFRAFATGALPMSYQWKCNGTNIPNATNAFLTITNVVLNTAGSYSVVISNPVDSIETPASALQIAPFYVTSMPTDKSTYRGGTVTLTTSATGKTPLRYQWRFNGTNISNAVSSSLTLSGIRLDQAGSYDVIISNAFGIATTASAQVAVGSVVSWSYNGQPHLDLPPSLPPPAAVATGYAHNLLLNKDGTVQAWGSNASGQTNVPDGLSGIVQICAGWGTSFALDTNGVVTAWPSDGTQIDMFAGSPPFISIAAGSGHTLGLTADGHVLAAGMNDEGQIDVPEGLEDVVAISAGGNSSAALRSDGTLVTWGNEPAPEGLTDIVAVSCGFANSVALRANGTVVAWGRGDSDQTNLPPSLTNVVAISAGLNHMLALRADGSLIAWGNEGEAALPPGLTNVIAISATGMSLAILGDGPPIPYASLSQPTKNGKIFRVLSQTEAGRTYRLETTDSLSPPEWIQFPLIGGDAREKEFIDPSAAGPYKFYRVRKW